jgi:hypothetical protein
MTLLSPIRDLFQKTSLGHNPSTRLMPLGHKVNVYGIIQFSDMLLRLVKLFLFRDMFSKLFFGFLAVLKLFLNFKNRDVTLSLFGKQSRLCFPNKAIEKSSCCISNDFELLKKPKFTILFWEIFRQAVICTNQDMLCFPNKDKVTSLFKNYSCKECIRIETRLEFIHQTKIFFYMTSLFKSIFF